MFWWLDHYYHLIKQTIKWLPIIWNDRQWDQNFLYRIIIFKLSLMEQHFRSDESPISDRLAVANRIKIARLLLERVEKDEYAQEDQPWSAGHKLKTYNDIEDSRNQDLELFGKILTKYSRTWWD